MIQTKSGVSRNAYERHLVGNAAETVVKLDLISKGYFVYTNDFCHGPADIIALKPEPNLEVLMVDVKSDSKRWLKGRNQKTRVSRKRTATQKKLGIVFAYVDPESKHIHWAKHQKL